jgi:hypothetical protein
MASARHKSLFASFSSEKEESSFFEKKEAKKLLLPAPAKRGAGGNRAGGIWQSRTKTASAGASRLSVYQIVEEANRFLLGCCISLGI